MALSGNKGEWSEVYTLLYLLSQSKLFSADEHLNKSTDFVNVEEIHRTELSNDIKYISNGANVNIINSTNNQLVLSITKAELTKLAKELFGEIKKGSGSAFTIDSPLEQKLRDIQINQIKEKSTNKGDINLVIYEPTFGVKSQKKLSIKSLAGGKPTLFNSNKTTNIRYKITDSTHNPMPQSVIDIINIDAKREKYITRIKDINKLGYKIEYDSYIDDIFFLNLQMLSSDLPEIMAFCVLEKYANRITKMRDVINNLNQKNPIQFNLTHGHPFYEYRIINFLIEVALGMTSKTPWTGIYDAVGGILIVKNTAEVLCYHLIDFNKFKQYLLDTTAIDNPSGGKHGYGTVYLENAQSYINLNFQIRA